VSEALVLVNTANIDRLTWLDWRRKGIGSSDASAVVGLNPWRTPWQVWLDKLGQMPDEENERMYWGRVLEPIVASEFARRTGYEVAKVDQMLQHPVHTFMLCNLDYVTQDPDGPAIVECKTTDSHNSEQWAEGVPEHYQIQAQHQMAVTGYAKVYMPVLIGGNRFLEPVPVIHRDDELIALLIEREAEFWGKVVSQTPPPLDAADTTIVNRLYQAEEGKVAVLDIEDLKHVEAYLQARTEEGAWKKRKDVAANALKAKLGAAEIGVIAGVERVWWREGKNGRRFECK
jgi:putative phage-type endonuclease